MSSTRGLGGGSADFIFMGAGIFPNMLVSIRGWLLAGPILKGALALDSGLG